MNGGFNQEILWVKQSVFQQNVTLQRIDRLTFFVKQRFCIETIEGNSLTKQERKLIFLRTLVFKHIIRKHTTFSAKGS